MKRNFEPSDKGLKCFIEQHGITLKINKGKTNTINCPKDPSCSFVVEAVDEARQQDDLPSQGTIESQSGNQLPTNKHCGRDVHCEWLNDMTQKFREKLSDNHWEEYVEKINPAGGELYRKTEI